MERERLNVFSPEIFLPLFVVAFYLAGLVLVDFSLRALFVVAVGVGTYLAVARIAGKLIYRRAHAAMEEREGYFERLLMSLLVVFVIDLALKDVMPVAVRASLYLVLAAAVFFLSGRFKIGLSGPGYLVLGLGMILVYVAPAFARFGFYGVYLNRTGGLMPAFLVGAGTIVAVYGLMKVASHLSSRNLFIVIGLISATVGPLMAAVIGYRAYAIIYIMPLVFQYYLERKRPVDFKAGMKAAAVIVLIFLYTYLATSVTRGVIYKMAPLDSPSAPAFVLESMEKGGYTYSDITLSNSEAGKKIITRPFFTYGVFLDVIDDSFPWGKSHGRLLLSLMPGVNLGRAATIDILGKPFSTSFFGLWFLEFGFPGVALYATLLGVSLAMASRLRDPKVYAIILTIIMLWLDTGPSVWWHWIPFISALLYFASVTARPGKQIGRTA